MVEEFVEQYTKLIVNNPEDITITKKMIDDNFCEITINSNPQDLGKLIGKNGNMINAIKTILNGCKAKDNISYKIQVQSI
jgi:predicted RNA-binding protein YlqC (UPF0109 family)